MNRNALKDTTSCLKKNPLICILFSAVSTNAPQIKDSLSEANRGLLYKPGDWLNLNCTSQPSRPPIRLTWFVNGREVSVSLVCMSIKATLYKRIQNRRKTLYENAR